MARRDILVVGASAGGVEALRILVGGLPASLPVAVFVVLHLSPYERSHLPAILARGSRLPVQAARDGMPITPGQVYVAVPDFHLLLERNQVRTTRGPRENRARPAVDVLFRSAAYHHGPRVIGIVLTGNLDDGTAGLWAVKDRGGIALVQSPQDAPFPSMPESALQHVAVDQVLPVSAMAAALADLTQETVSDDGPGDINQGMEMETRIALSENTPKDGSLQLGPFTPLTCPECQGSLVRVQEGPLLRYRCHVGHAFSHRTLLAQINEGIDGCLGHTLRAMEERTLLLRQLEEQQARADGATVSQYARLITASENWEQRVRDMIAEHHAAGQSAFSIAQATGKENRG